MRVVGATRIIKAHPGLGAPVSGIVLAARDDFSARYDLDRVKGIFIRRSHALYGQSYVGRILVLDKAKGGVATAWMFHEMAARGMAPLALLLNHANPVMAQGAAFGGVALMDRFEVDITTIVRSGDSIVVNPVAGEIRVIAADS